MPSVLVLYLIDMEISVCIFQILIFDFSLIFIFLSFLFFFIFYLPYMYICISDEVIFLFFSPFMGSSFSLPSPTRFLYLPCSLSVCCFSSQSLNDTTWFYIICCIIWHCMWKYVHHYNITQCSVDNRVWYSISFNNNTFIRMVGLHSCRLPTKVMLTLSNFSLRQGLQLKRRIM